MSCTPRGRNRRCCPYDRRSPADHRQGDGDGDWEPSIRRLRQLGMTTASTPAATPVWLQDNAKRSACESSRQVSTGPLADVPHRRYANTPSGFDSSRDLDNRIRLRSFRRAKVCVLTIAIPDVV
jgi:hypothetical protein